MADVEIMAQPGSLAERNYSSLKKLFGHIQQYIKYCQTPVLGLGLGVDFTFAYNNNKNNKKNLHLNFLRRNGTLGMKFGAQI